ncbi:MAG: tRNA epoxyqueuosine(34) reductase QueG [Flavobacteriaceae bacterium]|nr:tRNA epoxyqueuosine(34) reductase QueG [Flavobacteriaceae bacterium]MBT7459227.1 tRNA epoxyqueuosine(34) reductase QueG [Flavobacteriaceae bacterium]MDG0967139.1 tRNA epoxyqueuosine(34) reductase QueG [Flavobacteriaceae bacterium]
MNASELHSKQIKEHAKRLGFLSCGISKAGFLEDEAPRLEQWLAQGHHGSMTYMERNFDKRLDPTKLVPGAKSVVSLLYNYYPSAKQSDKEAPKLSKYAYGKDYHFVVKEKLKELMHSIEEEIGEVSGRAFVDSAPVLDKAWAAKGGLGWLGKHTNLISKKTGSFFFIAELIIDLPLEADTPVTDHCGSCTACIDACPTDAIIAPYQVDGSKCISHFTIELKDAIPQEVKGKFDNWAFGCDVCQDVCPWNRFSTPHQEPEFEPSPELMNLTKNDWHEITEVVFNRLFEKSAVQRTQFSGLQRNLQFLK